MDSLHKSSGSTLAEVLVAAAIVMVVALGISGAFAFYKTLDARNRIESTQIALESQILYAIQDPVYNFTVPADKISLASGTVPEGFSLKNTSSLAIATVGAQTYFDTLGNATTLGSGVDALMTELSIQCVAVPYVNCFVAYRISQNPAYSKKVENIVPLGSYGPLWQASDYMSIIPSSIYLGFGTATSCGAGTVGAMGFDAATTGISCISKPTPASACGVGGFAVGYLATALPGPTNYSMLTFDCRTFRALNCPAVLTGAGTNTYGAGYVLQSFNTTALDPRVAPPAVGTCVLEGMDTVGWETSVGGARQLGPASTIPQTAVCPMHYTTSHNPCTLANIVSASVHCSTGATLAPIAGTCTVTMVGNQVKAQVNFPTQPKCPAPGLESPVWYADTIVTGSCTLAGAVKTESAVGM